MKKIVREDWFETASVCDRGLVRAENQDSFWTDGPAGIFVVADGMGGGQGGAQASALAVRAFREGVRAEDDLSARFEAVRAAVAAANGSIAENARRAGWRQSGSTAAVLLLGDAPDGILYVVWVGDSRVYRIRGTDAEALTDDHTVANQLFGPRNGNGVAYSRKLPYAHVLTRALGVDERVLPDARRFKARAGDRFLVCSDGVHDMLPDGQIGEIVSAAPTPQAGIGALAEAIRAAGAVDNFTATLVFLKETAR